MKKLLILILSLLFTGIFLHAESLSEINIEGVDAIKKYIADAESPEKQQLLKLIQAGDKFAKLFLDSEICGCEPGVECQELVKLTEYPDYDALSNDFCKGWDRHLKNGAWIRDEYLVDTDTSLVSLHINQNAYQAVLVYESSLVGFFRDTEPCGINIKEFLPSWDTSQQGEPVRVGFTFDTNSYKVINLQGNTVIAMSHYVHHIPHPLAKLDCIGSSDEGKKRIQKFYDQFRIDLLNYQKTHQHKNIKK
ncbi:MAG: hypothetical protein PHO62_05145 [Sulfurimonas sp.]|uniref:hypothetical protein n=1 Tax=Sulfurimonas sp. TaxID=2022749 RepID=UPI002617B8C5|nr:hypothetical protein [Sulfurimonas sp.]MDD5372793.1 hypothetical protein [Sulfurimonas sp.]